MKALPGGIDLLAFIIIFVGLMFSPILCAFITKWLTGSELIGAAMGVISFIVELIILLEM